MRAPHAGGGVVLVEQLGGADVAVDHPTRPPPPSRAARSAAGPLAAVDAQRPHHRERLDRADVHARVAARVATGPTVDIERVVGADRVEVGVDVGAEGP